MAYKQPISRAQIASIRGVDPDGVLPHAAGPGLHRRRRPRTRVRARPCLYGTTPMFLEKLGLDSVDDLPPITQFVPEADVVEALEAGLRVRDARIRLNARSGNSRRPTGERLQKVLARGAGGAGGSARS